jgi:hypothetical protein
MGVVTPEQITGKMAERLTNLTIAKEGRNALEMDMVFNRALQPLDDLIRAAQQLYSETADYIRINNLGDIHHNQVMKDMRAALEKLGSI